MPETTITAILVIVAFVTGYTLCYHSMHSANSATKQALDSLLAAFNARFGVRTPVITPKPETIATEPLKDSIITDEKDIPKKAQFDLKPVDLRSLRAEAANKTDAANRELRRQMGLIEDHL